MIGWQEAVAVLCVVTGSVFDAEHRPIPSASVYLRAVGKNESLSAQTDSAGVYRFTVPSGSYTLGWRDGVPTEPFIATAGKATKIDLTTQPGFFDEPTFFVAGVTDNTYQGGHGSDTLLRSAETLTKATAKLGSGERSDHPLETVHELERAAELNPSESNLFEWGTELLSHRAPSAAAEVFTKGVGLFPRSVRMTLGLATAYYAAGSYPKAAQCFFEAADLDPNDSNPYTFLSNVQAREISDSAGYRERMARFARLQPNNALANYYYGASLHNRALLEKALALDSHLAPAHLQLGILYAQEHQYPKAIGAYQKAIGANPELAEAHYRLAEAYRLKGDDAKARQETAIYSDLAKRSAEKVQQERREIQRFVVALRDQKH
jgi:tetratricopeptide (TPR) repeat protein